MFFTARQNQPIAKSLSDFVKSWLWKIGTTFSETHTHFHTLVKWIVLKPMQPLKEAGEVLRNPQELTLGKDEAVLNSFTFF